MRSQDQRGEVPCLRSHCKWQHWDVIHAGECDPLFLSNGKPAISMWLFKCKLKVQVLSLVSHISRVQHNRWLEAPLQDCAGAEHSWCGAWALSDTPCLLRGIKLPPIAPCCMAVYLLPHCTELIFSLWTSCPQQLHHRPGPGYHSGIHIPEADILPANQIAPESMYI